MSTCIFDNFKGPNGKPANFPNGITINAGDMGGINQIGIAGAPGFGVGVCPGPLPTGMTRLQGFSDPTAQNYGNYIYSDGSIMVWIPAFYYKYGKGTNGVALNDVDIKSYSYFVDVATANTAGYALHRMFYDNGVQLGVFVDKYICSNNGGIASSIQMANPLSSGADHTPFASLTGAPANFYYGAIAAAKTRGANFFCKSRFIHAGLALLSLAHANASSSTTWCAWYNATNNFPKGCNNNALGDANDAALTFTSTGHAVYPNCSKTGSASNLAKTTHNGQNCGVADLNGELWEVSPGLVADDAGTTYYVLKTTTAMKNVTGGTGGATDLWGTAGLAALYDSLGATYGAALASSTTKLYGSAAQVLSEATSGLPWQSAGIGIPLVGGVGGTNLFGSDIFSDYRPAALCPISGGSWSDGSSAGVWAFFLFSGRGNSSSAAGFRSALYL